eukprot:366125-Chlamydomonas_euryale.AAC.7
MTGRALNSGAEAAPTDSLAEFFQRLCANVAAIYAFSFGLSLVRGAASKEKGGKQQGHQEDGSEGVKQQGSKEAATCFEVRRRGESRDPSRVGEMVDGRMDSQKDGQQAGCLPQQTRVLLRCGSNVRAPDRRAEIPYSRQVGQTQVCLKGGSDILPYSQTCVRCLNCCICLTRRHFVRCSSSRPRGCVAASRLCLYRR